jgi:hypothetical protein
MGVDPLPGTRIVSTLHRGASSSESWLEDLPILGTTLTIKHTGTTQSTVTNTGSRPVTWRATFTGTHTRATIGTRARTTIGTHTATLKHQKDKWGHDFSYIDVPLSLGQTIEVKIL